MGVTRTELRTYSHLADRKRVPTSYEVRSTGLLYYPHHGFSVATECDEWYERYQAQSPLSKANWEEFVDPRSTTYAAYVARQRDREVALDADLAEVLDSSPSPMWLNRLDQVFAPLRFPGHGLMMASAYVGSMARDGKIVITSALQAADEMRRVHRFARKLARYQQDNPGLGDRAKEAWETDETWRPLRRLVERLLLTYDWGECLTALNLAVKPMFDHLLGQSLTAVARDEGDHSLALICTSLEADTTWHHEWICELVRECVPRVGRLTIAGWVAEWQPQVLEALAPVAEAMGAADAVDDAAAAHHELLELCGMETR